MQFPVLLAALLLAPPAAIPTGKGEIEVTVRDQPLQVYTYRPENYDGGPLIVVFHGILRNADEYRDHAVGMGDRFQALIAAPKFDDQRFPKERYQRAGIIDSEGKAIPPDERTGAYIPKIVAEIRRRESKPNLKYYLIGHSAGGQFLERTSAFVQTGAERIVAANPGTHLFPVKDAAYPLGFADLPASLMSDEQLRFYLAQPLTLYLGSGDVVRDEYFAVDPASDAQGKTRWERGQNVFAAAKKLAQDIGWKFGWRLVVADGVDHDHEKMFNDEACRKALFGEGES
jgi:pimeloyl-ACP methyl ester carboxylesterase